MCQPANKLNKIQFITSINFLHVSELIINFIALSALAGWCINYKNTHDINNIKCPQIKSWNFENYQEKGEYYIII